MRLTKEQKELFDLLYEDRQETAKVLEKQSMRGVKISATEKYSEQAHFIYELLQNADDVKATNAKFILEENRLIYIHNGSIGFTISDVRTEKQDTDNHCLGHINSITSIGNSNKYGAQIGKFGVGFKAIFQYTETPHIYDDVFSFKIEKFIVPILLNQDFQDRNKGETVFYFPFDKLEKKPDECFTEIFKGFKKLSHPLLFLRNLKKIEWKTAQMSGTYEKQLLSEFEQDSILVQEIRLIQQIEQETKESNLSKQKLYIFSRETKYPKHLYSIAYRVTENNQVLYDQELPAYCFFATKEITKLKFFIQAPFLLTDSREGIKQGEKWNKDLIDLIATLSADSLKICKNIGLINDNFFNVLPINHIDFLNNFIKNQFKPIYDRVLEKLKIDELLPVDNGKSFTTSQNAYLGSGKKLIELLNMESENEIKVLTILTNNNNAKWVFSTITDSQRNLWNYIKTNLVKDVIDSEKFANKITKEFIEKQTDLWLIEFYSFILDVPRLWKKSRFTFNNDEPILRKKEIISLEGKNKNIVAAFDLDDNPLVFLPTSLKSTYPTVKKCFISNPRSLQFLKELGIDKPNEKDEIYQKIIPKYEKNNLLTMDAFEKQNDVLIDFEKMLIYSRNCPSSEKESFIARLKKISFCLGNDSCLHQPNSLYLSNNKLEHYFEGYKNVLWFNKTFYKSIYEKYGNETVNKFLKEVGVEDKPRIIRINDVLIDKQLLQNIGFSDYNTYSFSIVDYNLEGLDNLLDHVNKDKSLFIWNYLIELLNNFPYYYVLDGSLNFNYKRKPQKYNFASIYFLRKLRNTAWIYDKNGIISKPSEICLKI